MKFLKGAQTWRSILGTQTFFWPLTPEGMLSYCTWAQDAASTKTQKENRLVGGLKDHGYLSVTRTRHRGASGQATNTQSNGSQRYVMNHRQAGTTGPELLTKY